jgi:NitT/TauT family transport system ATP-binding protein
LGQLRITNLEKRFGTRSEATLALSGLSLTLADGEFVSLIGSSGCGKSTALSIVAGLEAATAGQVEIDSEPIIGPGRDRAVVFQSYTLMPWLTALENVELALSGTTLARKERRQVAMQQLALVGLKEFAHRLPATLSGGMRQRVAIARSLSYQPRLLLMDEPFGALDSITRRHMQDLLLRVWALHRPSILFVTHDIDEALFLSDRVLLLTARPGRLKLELTVELPRPRTDEMLVSPTFTQMKRQLLDAIRKEGSLMSGEN